MVALDGGISHNGNFQEQFYQFLSPGMFFIVLIEELLSALA